MMSESSWLARFRFDPIAPLLESGNHAVEFFTRRDLMDQNAGAPTSLWDLRIPRAIVRKQNADGSWTYPGRRAWSRIGYDQLETYRELGFLVDKFGYDRSYPAIALAAEFLLAAQTDEGDIRGLYGAQYSPNYSAAMFELLVKAGYADDDRVERGFRWLTGFRQEDGGWALPLRTRRRKLDAIEEAKTIQPDRSAPFSHFITGIVLRAFAAHPVHSRSEVALRAGALLAGRFFQKDTYPDKGRVADWTEFCYPFWSTDLISSLDSLSRMGFSGEDPNIRAAVSWLNDKQDPSGLFTLHLLKDRHHDMVFWIDLAICRVYRRLYGSSERGDVADRRQ